MSNALAQIKSVQAAKQNLKPAYSRHLRQAERDALTTYLIAGIIGDPDGECIRQCAGLSARHFSNPMHWRIFSAYKALQHSPDPDTTWRDPRVISAISGVPIQTIFKIGHADLCGYQFNDSLQQLIHAH